MEQSIQAGDAVFFWGGGFLGDGIRIFSGGLKMDAPSHVARIYDIDMPLPDGSKQVEWHVIEATILNGVNGVQLNTLASRVNGYEGACGVAHLSAKVREFLDWPRMLSYAQTEIGKQRYNDVELAEYLADAVLPGFLQIDRTNPRAVVCSELAANLLRAGGWPALDPPRTSPLALFSWRMYDGFTVLGGNPPMDRFNRV